ncbi:MAG: VWA domain-containing protein [Candidatus Omnitrophica bacterium]|nr:VWA domain-containing protein [Candidatus Omnitrophota bacterium]
MNQAIPILAVIVWVITFLLYRPSFFRRPLAGERRWLLALIQVIPLLLLVWLLGNPFSDREIEEKREGSVVVLLDDSPSMGMEDGVTGRPRIDVARDWIDGFLSRKNTSGTPGKWVLYGLDDIIPAGKSGSDFAQAFEEVGRRIPQRLLDGVLFISDGRDHGDRSAQSAAKKLGVPVHTLGIGPDTQPDTLRVRWKEAPEEVYPGSPFLVRWAIDSDQPREEAHDLTVSFASREVHHDNLTLPEGRVHREGWITIRPEEPGEHLLRVTIQDENRPERKSTADRKILVKERPKTLLVLESEPSRLVQSLSQVALQSGRFRILRPVSLPEGGGVLWDLSRPYAEEGESVSQFWSREGFTRYGADEWGDQLQGPLDEASVVVLGRAPIGSAPESWVEVLTKATEREDLGWLALPGSEMDLDRFEDSSLANLLEREGNRKESRESIRILFAEQGKDHPALAPLWSYQDGVWEIGSDSYFRVIMPTMQVLLTDPQDRGLVVQVPFGLGKATLVSTSNLWKLRSFAGWDVRGDREAGFLSGLWLGILDDLSGRERSQEIRLTLDPEKPTVGQSTRIQVEDPSLTPGQPRGGLEIRETQSEWETLLVSPDPEWSGIGEAVWTPRSSGEYEIRYASGENPLAVTVTDRPSESEDLSLNEETLQEIAEDSGGAYSRLAEVDPAAIDLKPTTHVIERTDKTPLRHDLWLGILVAGLFCMGWGLRRAWSLP